MRTNENIELKRIIDILKSKKILIMIVLILFILLGYLYSYYYVVPEYKSSTTLLIIPNSTDENRTVTNSDLTLNSGLISTYSNIAKNSKVLKQVISNLNLDMTESQLLNSMQIDVVKNTHIMEITVTNSDSQKAFEITKELANVFLDEIKQIYNLENIGIVDEAQLPGGPYNINHMKDISMFFIVGVIISSLYIIMVYLFDNTIKTEEDIEKYIKIKSLGAIPINIDKDEIINKKDSKSYITECINTLRTNILYMNSTQNNKTILITSCMPREGKSWTSANIATSFAEINKKVLLIDSDMRKGRANKIFDVDNKEGLSNYLYFITGDVEKDIELGKKYIKETKVPNLHILTNGTIPPNPSELLGSNEMKELLKILKNVYDIIIIDAPPCKLVSDSIVLSTIVDSTILVADSNNTKINDLIEVKKSIDIVDGKIMGAIVNKVEVTKNEYGKNYYYGHDVIQNEKSEEKENKIITVNEIINQSVNNLKLIDFDIEEVIEETETISDSNETMQENLNISKIIKKQDKSLKELVNSISDIKVTLNNNLMQNKLKKQKEDEFQKYISQKNENTIELNKISSQLEEIKLKNEEILNNSYSEKIDNIFNEINDVKSSYDQMIEKIEKTNNDLIETNQSNKKDHEEYITQKIEEIQRKNNIELKAQIREVENSIDLKEISNQLEKIKLGNEEILNNNYTEKIDNIFNEINDVKTNYNQLAEKVEEIKEKDANDNISSETIKLILREEMSKIDYIEQINYMNEMITNLKDSYLELSNIIRTNNISDEQIDTSNNNIIDIKMFKKEKERKQKKKAFPIEENISYYELEKTAACIIPLPIINQDDNVTESYESIM